MQFWLHPTATCPKCKQATVKLSYIEADNGNAILNYACDKCGMVKVTVIPLKPRGKEEK